MVQDTLVSIIVPAYNAQEFIAETINSVLTQTYKNWELIIVDDGSTDNTAQVIKPFLSDERIKYFYQQNGRQGKARNLAIKNSQGFYLAFLDADDLWAPEKLEIQIQCMLDKKVDLVYTNGWRFNLVLGNNLVNYESSEGIGFGQQFLMKLLQKNSIAILSVLVKKSVVTSLGGFSENPKVQNSEDYQLWLKLVDNNCVFYGLNQQLFYYRVHPNQSTQNIDMMIIPKLWSIAEIDFKTITLQTKNIILNKKLNNALTYLYHTLPYENLMKVIYLYSNPINKPVKYIFCKISLLFGRKVFGKIVNTFFAT